MNLTKLKKDLTWIEYAHLNENTTLHLVSDNYDILCTPKQYKEIVLQMSSGDFACHIVTIVPIEVIDMLLLCGAEFYCESLN